MARARRDPDPDPGLTRLLRKTRALDPAARRHWLAVLPHLTPEDRERLRQILLEAEREQGTRAGMEPGAEAGTEPSAEAPSSG